MSIQDDIYAVFEEQSKALVNYMREYVELAKQQLKEYDLILSEAKQYKKTGKLNILLEEDLEEVQNAENAKDHLKLRSTAAQDRSSSTKENDPNQTASIRTTRSKTALKEASILINQQDTFISSDVVVKMERITLHATEIGKNAIDFPAPLQPAPRNTRKKKVLENSSNNFGNIQIKVEPLSDNKANIKTVNHLPTINSSITDDQDNDVQIEQPEIDTIILDTTTDNIQKPIRTRTKKRQIVEENILQESSNENKKLRLHSENQTSRITRSTLQTVVQPNNPLLKDVDIENDKTVKKIQKNGKPNGTLNTIQIESNLLNTTITITKSQNVEKNEKFNINDIMTEDEDDTPLKPIAQAQKSKNTKAVFSPYENSPVKKRVEAFEKLEEQAKTGTVPRTTRNRAKAQQDELKSDLESCATNYGGSKTSKSGWTPLMDSKLKPPSVYKLLYASSSSQKSANGKTGSALKASQSEFKERELRRKQKELEASQKKEAILHAQTEERKRKLQEKQLKAQQQRDAIEKDKLRALENAEKRKEDKIKLMLAEKEERLQKQKEEAAYKRALAAKKAIKEKNKNLKSKQPLYLNSAEPLLPTPDCYDSDDSNYGSIPNLPEWQLKAHLKHSLHVMQYFEPEKRYFFCMRPLTPNLQDIFPGIQLEKLKRTSSAIWNKSKLEAMMEEDEIDQ